MPSLKKKNVFPSFVNVSNLAFLMGRKRKKDQIEQDQDLYPSSFHALEIYALFSSLLLWLFKHVPAEHEIEPQPRPPAANAPRRLTSQPVIPLARRKASDSLYSSSRR